MIYQSETITGPQEIVLRITFLRFLPLLRITPTYPPRPTTHSLHSVTEEQVLIAEIEYDPGL
jgi:hypothetical protein